MATAGTTESLGPAPTSGTDHVSRQPKRSDEGLPVNLDAERYILGCLLHEGHRYNEVSETIRSDFFSIEKHRRIFRRMGDIIKRGGDIDRVSIAEELNRKGELELIDGLSYLVSLDEGLPSINNIGIYVQIVRDKAMLRSVIFRSRDLAMRAMSGEETAEEILASANATIQELYEEASQDGDDIKSPLQVLEQADGGVESFFNPGKAKPAMSTGIAGLDRIIYGLIPGQVYVLAGNPADGKSTGALTIFDFVIGRRIPSLFFSVEMDKDTFMYRLMCGRAGVSLKRFLKGRLVENERQAVKNAFDYYDGLPMWVDDTPQITIAELETKVRRAYRKHGIKVVVVDYTQFMNMQHSGDGIKFRNQDEALTYISQRYVKMARDMRISVLHLSQFNKSQFQRVKSDRRPQLNDLHGSGSLAKDAHVVMALFREGKLYPNRTELKDIVEWIVLKHRNGPDGMVKVKFSNYYLRFCEAEPELDYPDDD